jgi:hypothetical protein
MRGQQDNNANKPKEMRSISKPYPFANEGILYKKLITRALPKRLLAGQTEGVSWQG